MEILTTLHVSAHSLDWYQFTVSSVFHSDWTEHASGLVSLVPAVGRELPDLDKNMDSRAIEASDWYECFTQVGLGYGATFQGYPRF